MLARDVRAAADPAVPGSDLDALLPTGWRAWRPLARAQAIEIVTFLSPYLLCSQGDRVAMAHGVEVRYPFLDPDVVDFCCGLPGRLKLRGLRDKFVLRRLATRYLPPDICARPKQPYRAPMTRALFANSDHDYVHELLTPRYLERFGLVDPAATQRLADKARQRAGRMSGEREEMALVGVLTLQLLAHHFLERFAHRAAQLHVRLERKRPAVLKDYLETSSVRARHPASRAAS